MQIKARLRLSLGIDLQNVGIDCKSGEPQESGCPESQLYQVLSEGDMISGSIYYTVCYMTEKQAGFLEMDII